MVINIAKTKESVFHRHDPRLQLDNLAYVHYIEQIKGAKLLGVIFKDILHFDLHVDSIFKTMYSAQFF